MNITDFDTLVEMSLDKEGEKHITTEPAALHIPKDMIHYPLNFKFVNKPIIFINVVMTPEYIKTPAGKSPSHS